MNGVLGGGAELSTVQEGAVQSVDRACASSITVNLFFSPFCFEGGIRNVIVLVPDHCRSFILTTKISKYQARLNSVILKQHACFSLS